MRRFVDLFGRVCRETAEGVGARDGEHVREGEIALAHVHAVRGRHRGDIGAVVDDDASAGIAAFRHGVANHAQQVGPAPGLLTDLQQACPAAQEGGCDLARIEASQAAKIDVNDGVERGEQPRQLPRDRHPASSARAYTAP